MLHAPAVYPAISWAFPDRKADRRYPSIFLKSILPLKYGWMKLHWLLPWQCENSSHQGPLKSKTITFSTEKHIPFYVICFLTNITQYASGMYYPPYYPPRRDTNMILKIYFTDSVFFPLFMTLDYIPWIYGSETAETAFPVALRQPPLYALFCIRRLLRMSRSHEPYLCLHGRGLLYSV